MRNFSICRNALRTTLVLQIALSLPAGRVAAEELLVHHQLRTDPDGYIMPWYSADPGEAYNYVILRVWNFWKNMKACPNGVKYYMQHQVWQEFGEDPRGLGGDQLSMALSSWNLLYGYTGDRSVVENMVYMADYWLDHGLSRPGALWPNLPYPYNTDLHSGIYDGDMVAGKGFLQPDKAASFGAELLVLYKITSNPKYLKAAIAIADTLARRISAGDNDHSPWPYRVHAETGEVSLPYTTNYTGALRLLDDLIQLRQGDVSGYQAAHKTVSEWLRRYPMRSQKWGPFFEDVPGWSDTEINADTMAFYILEHPEWDPNWREDAAAILNWSRTMFANPTWLKYGVMAINEQTAYRVPGNSHTARHAATQLLYAEKTGDSTHKADAIRQLNWATYMVGEKGNNRYPRDDVWLTDGYGDYVRHYLRAMAAAPELAPKRESHLLRTSSVIRSISYAADRISYTTFDTASRELFRLAFVPTTVMAGGKRLPRLKYAADLDQEEGYTFESLGDVPGVLRIRHDHHNVVEILCHPVNQPPVATSRSVRVYRAESVEIMLDASDDGRPVFPPHLHFSFTGPYQGSISGNALLLSYTPPADFLGQDVLVFWASDGELLSNTGQVTFQVVRPNLPQLPEATPFTTDDPQTGASGVWVLPALADGDLTTALRATFDSDATREVSVGLP